MAKAAKQVLHPQSTRNDSDVDGAERHIIHTIPLSPTAAIWQEIRRAEVELEALDDADEKAIGKALARIDKLWASTATHDAADFADVLRQLMAARRMLEQIDCAKPERSLRWAEYHIDAAVRGITRFTCITPMSLATALSNEPPPAEAPSTAG